MKTKRSLLLLAIIAIFTISTLSAATVLGSSPAATVNLIRSKIITNAELDTAVTSYGATADQKLEVLNILINDEVFAQGAERDGITITNAQLNQLYAQQKANVSQQYGYNFTDAEFEIMVKEQYGTVDTYKNLIKQQYIIQTYLAQEKTEQINSYYADPTDTEIRTFYRNNKSTFIQNENVKLAWVYMEKTGNATRDAQNKKTLETALQDIKNNKMTFEQAVNKYTEDLESKALGGEVGWLVYDNTTAREGFGDPFVNSIFDLSVGVPALLESNVGYHIVRTSVHNDTKILGIDDRINPEQTTTVYEYIGAYLSQAKQEEAINKALGELVTELRAEATIRILLK